MSSFLANVASDSQTSITCVSGAVLGAAASATATYIASITGGTGSGLGGVGIEFVLRCITSAAFFQVGEMYLPETSNNILFAFLFFGANPGLISSGVALGQTAVGAITGVGARFRGAPKFDPMMLRTGATNPIDTRKPSCGTGTCGRQ